MSIERYVFKKKFVNLKYKYGNRHFWCTEFYVNIVGRNKKVIEEYIKNQQKEDMMSEQISIKGYIDIFLRAASNKICSWKNEKAP
ncbi:transposase IS200 like family protein [Clostridium botulinum]|nr:transposase [Clostridium botulinum]APQ98606.1 transposase IS200 like family protein [Clostridium botulinum]